MECGKCRLVFVPREFFLSPDDEKAEYELHENNPHDEGYRKFLSRLYDPLIYRLPAGSRGLDFGCGPGPTLSLMFEEAGFLMEIYDHFFAPHPEVLKKSYEFITATEVVEHLHYPMAVFQNLWNVLKTKGYLGLMTKRVKSLEAFKTWHYKNDMTHICFFSEVTFRWLADYLSASLEFIGKDVVIMQKL